MPHAPQAVHLGDIAKRLSSEVRQHDTSRPVTGALAGVIMSNHTDYPGALDICGYNYTENRYDQDHAEFPERVIYGSENGHGMEAWNRPQNNLILLSQNRIKPRFLARKV